MINSKKKICIIGSSGSGKSTLAKTLGSYLNINHLHIDTIAFNPNWQRKEDQKIRQAIEKFCQNDRWIIDGNYTSIYPERFSQADLIIFLDYNRFFCFKEAYKRFKNYKGKKRDSVATGCDEKFDFQFAKWILVDYPRTARKRVRKLAKSYSDKLLKFKKRKQLKKYLSQLKIS